jgi:hypothetical protein
MIKSLLTLCLFFAINATAPAMANANGSFVQPTFSAVSEQAPVVIAGVSFKVLLESISGLTGPDSQRYRLVAGVLDRASFEKLHKSFNSESRVSFDPNRVYEITDFLRPLVGALDGKQFKIGSSRSAVLNRWIDAQDDETDKSDSSRNILTVTNCWTTALEFVRGNPQNLNIYYPSPAVAAQVFTDGTYFREVASQQVQYGDLLFIHNVDPRSDTMQAHHAAVYIAADFFFEKTGSASELLYRINRKKHILKSYPAGTYQWSFIRSTGTVPPAPEYYSIATMEPEIAKTLGPSLASKLSVDLSFGQGMTGYSFTTISTRPLPK